MTLTIEQKEEIRRLNSEDMPKTHIAKRIGVCTKSVYNVLGREEVGTIIEVRTAEPLTTRTIQQVIMVKPVLIKQEKYFLDSRLLERIENLEFNQLLLMDEVENLELNQSLLALKVYDLSSVTFRNCILIGKLRSEINSLPQISQLQVDIKAQEIKYKLAINDINIL